MIVNETQIDTLAQEILSEFDESGEEWLNTVELRERLKLGANSDGSQRNQNRKIKHRFDKLTSAVLATVRAGGTDADGRTLPKEMSLTDEGWGLIESYDLGDGVSDTSDESVGETLDRLERVQKQSEAEMQEDIDDLFTVLGVLFSENGIDPASVEPYGIDPDRLGGAFE